MRKCQTRFRHFFIQNRHWSTNFNICSFNFVEFSIKFVLPENSLHFVKHDFVLQPIYNDDRSNSSPGMDHNLYICYAVWGLWIKPLTKMNCKKTKLLSMSIVFSDCDQRIWIAIDDNVCKITKAPSCPTFTNLNKKCAKLGFLILLHGVLVTFKTTFLIDQGRPRSTRPSLNM